MTERLTFKLKIRDVTAEYLDRFPDGDYTVGRGADPRGQAEREPDAAEAGARPAAVPEGGRKPRRSRKPVRPAAE